MKTVKINGKKLGISASDERALRLLAAQDYCAATSDFTQRRGKWMSSDLPHGDQQAALGITPVSHFCYSKRAAKFMAARPRVLFAYEGAPRRVNAILRQL